MLVALVVIGALGFVGLWFGWGPAKVHERVVSMLETRTGEQVELAEASLRWNGVVLQDLRVGGSEGAIEVAVGRIGVQGSLWGMAFGSPREAVEHIEVREVQAELRMERWPPPEEVDEAEEGSAESDPGEQGSALPTIEIVGASLRVTDADGLLAQGSGDLRVQDGKLELRTRRAELGSPGEDRVEVAAAEVDLPLERPLRLTRVRIVDPRLEVGEARGTVARLRRLRETIAPPPDEATPSEEPEDGVPGWMTRLEDGGEVEFEGGSAFRGEAELVTAAAVRLTREDSQLHVTVEARAEGGELGADLRIEPGALRGSGNVRMDGVPFALLVPVLPDLPWHQPERGRVEGELTLAAATPAAVEVGGRLAIRDVGIAHERISPRPLMGLGLEGTGAATWHSSERRLEIREATIASADVSVQVVGELVRQPERYAIDLRATLPPTDCDQAMSAIPRDVMAELTGFTWAGRIGGRAELEVRSEALDDTRVDLRIANGCRFVSVPAAADLRRFQGPFLHRVREPDGTTFEMTAGPGSPNWTSIHAISPFVVQAVVGHEDGGFFRHSGFSTHAMRDALVRNLEEGRFVRGASTITMQLAKNLFLHREKTLARKVHEVLLTWWLESALDKEEILELYLNVIEYGPSVYGITHAADYYFGREPSELSAVEAAYLACLLPDPKGYHTSYERGSLTRAMRNRTERFLRHLASRERIDAVALEEGLAQLDAWRFHRPGDPVAPRQLRGRAQALPFASGEPEGWLDMEGEPVEDETEPEGDADAPR